MQRCRRIVRGGCAAVVLGMVAGTAWAWPWEVCTLVPPDGGAGDYFGYAVALSDAYIVVGAPGDADNGADSGSAYVFDAHSRAMLHKLVPADGYVNGRFGEQLAISGGVVVVGSNGPYSTGLGSAYVFDLATGQQLHQLVPEVRIPGDQFGHAVAIDGALALIGACGDRTYGENSGAAYLFDVASGQQLRRFEGPVPREFATFGLAVALCDGIAIISAPYDVSGVAYAFDVGTGAYLGALLHDPWTDAEFGWSLTASCGLAVVGSNAFPDYNLHPDMFEQCGNAAVFDLDTRERLFTLWADDIAEFDEFSYSVAMDGSRALISSVGDDDLGPRSGSAYLFDVTSGTQIAKLLASEGAGGDNFGMSVAIRGDRALVGASSASEIGWRSGKVYVFELGPATCPPDMNSDGVLDYFDVQAFLSAWTASDPRADFALPAGVFNFFDVQAFLRAFEAGCP